MPKELKKPVCKPSSRCKKDPPTPHTTDVHRRCYNIAAKPNFVCTPRTCVPEIIAESADVPTYPEDERASKISKKQEDDSEAPYKVICLQKFDISCLSAKSTKDESMGTDGGIGYDEFGRRIDRYGNIIGGDGTRTTGLCICCKCDPCTCGPKYAVEEGIGEDMVQTAATGPEPVLKKLTEDVSCTCLPGLCICPGALKKKEERDEKAAKEKEKLGSGVSIPSCLCLHHEESKHYISPATTIHSAQTSVQPKSYSSIVCTCPRYQRTLAIIKPSAMIYRDVILRAITQEGLDIVHRRIVHLTPEQVSDLYEQYYGSPKFPIYVMEMSIGPTLVLQLAGINAVDRWNNMVGPDRILPTDWFLPLSVRQRFGIQADTIEAVHASENLTIADTENRYFFPRSILEPILTNKNEVEDYMNKYINPTLLKGLANVVRNKPRDPILYLAEFLVTRNPYMPKLTRVVAMAPT